MAQVPRTIGVLLATGAAVAVAALIFSKRRSRDALRGNSSARGSLVLRKYGEAVRGRVFIVTGATSGLGLEMARLLAQVCLLIVAR